eukprot:gb/GEZN01008785.1/.p1 GENE.gb/GEZN01008785.1/~~gb/GEZN01008785.1/.p1  ORF type:complete len:331 (-),score=35.48 gb/GEZN01008785.1/:76-1068(-)
MSEFGPRGEPTGREGGHLTFAPPFQPWMAPASVLDATLKKRLTSFMHTVVERMTSFSSSQGNLPSEVPFVTLTYAQSLDGSISASKGTQLILSGKESMAMTHCLRAIHAGIIVGIGTVLADDPSLSVRHVHGPDPRPIIIDTRLRFPLTAKFLKRKPIVCTTGSELKSGSGKAQRRFALEKAGCTVVDCKEVPGGVMQVDLHDMFRKLKRFVDSVMVEGGATVISSLLQQPHLIHQMVVTTAPVLVGGYHAVTSLLSASSSSAPSSPSTSSVIPPSSSSPLLALSGTSALALTPSKPSFPRLTNVSYVVLGDDIVCRGDFQNHKPEAAKS